MLTTQNVMRTRDRQRRATVVYNPGKEPLIAAGTCNPVDRASGPYRATLAGWHPGPSGCAEGIRRAPGAAAETLRGLIGGAVGHNHRAGWWL